MSFIEDTKVRKPSQLVNKPILDDNDVLLIEDLLESKLKGITKAQLQGLFETHFKTMFEELTNKVTEWDGPTDDQYPSAKLVWDEFQIMKGHIAVTSWDQLGDIVRQGDASKYFAVGDEFMCGISGLPPQIVHILGFNQDKKVGDPTAPTMTIGFKDILWRQTFDAPEPSNSDSSRRSYGNNQWAVSNLRQYLNSDDPKFVFTAAHGADATPIGYSYNATLGPLSIAVYAGPGFLHRIEESLARNLVTVTKRTAFNTATDGGGFGTSNERVFLLSRKEAGLGDEGDVDEEFVYQYYNGSINADRIKLDGAGEARYWWLRSPYVTTSYIVRIVNADGSLSSSGASYVDGVAPACVIG